MPDAKSLYENLLRNGYTKQEIDSALHEFLLLRIKENNTAYTAKPEKNTSLFAFFCLKNLRLLKHITAKGLCLLKTQFAKKPKNPV